MNLVFCLLSTNVVDEWLNTRIAKEQISDLFYFYVFDDYYNMNTAFKWLAAILKVLVRELSINRIDQTEFSTLFSEFYSLGLDVIDRRGGSSRYARKRNVRKFHNMYFGSL